MIYSTNRTASLGEITCDVNESYFGIGAMSFLEEAAQDELAIFEAAIKSDIDEVMIGESADELSALNEGFVQTAAKKVKEMMKKFIEWIAAVTRSAFAKLSQLVVRDNAKFAAMAKKQIIKMKNKDKFKFNGKYIKSFSDSVSTVSTLEQGLKGLATKLSSGSITEGDKDMIEKLKDDVMKLSVSEAMKEVVAEAKDEGLSVIESQIKILESHGKSAMQALKKDMDKSRKEAADIASKASKDEKNAKDEEKEAAAIKVQGAAAYKVAMQKIISFKMAFIKSQLKVARAAVAKAMGATPKNEGVEYDEELTMAMIESADFEYDEALEEMSEGKDCDCDSEDDSNDDDEE